MRKTTEGHDFGIMWGQKKLADLDFADDLALLCHTQQAPQDMTDRLHLFGKKSWATYQWREDKSYDSR